MGSKHELTEEDEQWVKDMAKFNSEGLRVAEKASTEALEYLMQILPEMEDINWRKLMIAKHGIEIGIAEGLVDITIPKVYDQMAKNMHRKTGLSKGQVDVLKRVYLGRVIQNINEAMNGRNK